ncbi:hypothetical protein CS062_17310 [Roseateles chitinivorans]|uniref:Uncharacterized protein n=2 Tax=Roseateles chitinivorans TaxID=2917965 RepID=A0A2G9C8D1_9BURK|nr:hypothetical protein CS062_17310 [Roseateles chitinivorans]
MAVYSHAVEAIESTPGQWSAIVRTIKKVQGVSNGIGDARIHRLPGTFATMQEAQEAGLAWSRSEFKPW